MRAGGWEWGDRQGEGPRERICEREERERAVGGGCRNGAEVLSMFRVDRV